MKPLKELLNESLSTKELNKLFDDKIAELTTWSKEVLAKKGLDVEVEYRRNSSNFQKIIAVKSRKYKGEFIFSFIILKDKNNLTVRFRQYDPFNGMYKKKYDEAGKVWDKEINSKSDLEDAVDYLFATWGEENIVKK